MKVLYQFSTSSEKLIEKILDDGNAMLNHVILPFGEKLPEHDSNANTYFVIIHGKMNLTLGDEKTETHEAGTIIFIPRGIKMNISSGGPNVLEFFIFKAPPPEKEN